MYKIYLNELVDQNLLIHKYLPEGVINAKGEFHDYQRAEKTKLTKTHENHITPLQSLNFQKFQNSFNNLLNHQARFSHTFMKMFEYLLLFIRATQQQISELLLVCLHELVKYFFAFNVQIYSLPIKLTNPNLFSLNVCP